MVKVDPSFLLLMICGSPGVVIRSMVSPALESTNDTVSGVEPGGFGRSTIWLIPLIETNLPRSRNATAVHEGEVPAGRTDVGEQELRSHLQSQGADTGRSEREAGRLLSGTGHELDAELARIALREGDRKRGDGRVAEQDHPFGSRDLRESGAGRGARSAARSAWDAGWAEGESPNWI